MIALLFTIIIALVVAGFICWIVSVLPFVPPPLKQIVQGVVLFVTLLWLLYTLYGAFVGGVPAHRGFP